MHLAWIFIPRLSHKPQTPTPRFDPDVHLKKVGIANQVPALIPDPSFES